MEKNNLPNAISIYFFSPNKKNNFYENFFFQQLYTFLSFQFHTNYFRTIFRIDFKNSIRTIIRVKKGKNHESKVIFQPVFPSHSSFRSLSRFSMFTQREGWNITNSSAARIAQDGNAQAQNYKSIESKGFKGGEINIVFLMLGIIVRVELYRGLCAPLGLRSRNSGSHPRYFDRRSSLILHNLTKINIFNRIQL